jgi:hypothetical protein
VVVHGGQRGSARGGQEGSFRGLAGSKRADVTAHRGRQVDTGQRKRAVYPSRSLLSREAPPAPNEVVTAR